jgi:hypothetical protein
MTRWRLIGDIWADDDPALRRLREGLAHRVPMQPPRTDAAAEPTDEEVEAEVRALISRLRAGDTTAKERLARLLDRLGQA